MRVGEWTAGAGAVVVNGHGGRQRASRHLEVRLELLDGLGRVDGLLAEGAVGLPCIYQELADGSQRLVREDGKPLQWHRMTEEIAPAADAPVPLSEETLDLFGPGKEIRMITSEPEDEEAPAEVPGVHEADDPRLGVEAGIIAVIVVGVLALLGVVLSVRAYARPRRRPTGRGSRGNRSPA